MEYDGVYFGPPIAPKAAMRNYTMILTYMISYDIASVLGSSSREAAEGTVTDVVVWFMEVRVF